MCSLLYSLRKGADVLDIAREHFPLLTLGARIQRFEDELIDGRGFQ